jgi:hypothetical protein
MIPILKQKCKIGCSVFEEFGFSGMLVSKNETLFHKVTEDPLISQGQLENDSRIPADVGSGTLPAVEIRFGNFARRGVRDRPRIA